VPNCASRRRAARPGSEKGGPRPGPSCIISFEYLASAATEHELGDLATPHPKPAHLLVSDRAAHLDRPVLPLRQDRAFGWIKAGPCGPVRVMWEKGTPRAQETAAWPHSCCTTCLVGFTPCWVSMLSGWEVTARKLAQLPQIHIRHARPAQRSRARAAACQSAARHEPAAPATSWRAERAAAPGPARAAVPRLARPAAQR